ncbi:magnesium transporter CorA [Tersicoccus solisilvae]|uniref:Magnesium transporter CorA n=1 Tax=Tersicoccus solisilvae TaxID=1882339 RepID=A0ABQ1P6P6_9MICC|nr:magnesium transporter CorA family protein [Tersicoccus solisilvae]GGC92281.1 magnesium transporter CorA [Tersicoccus solisilvae]
MLSVRVFRDGRHEDRRLDVDGIAELSRDPAACLWVCLPAGRTDDVGRLLPALGVHQLAVEDVVTEHQRPKLERYADHLFLNAYAVRVDDRAGRGDGSGGGGDRMPRLALTEVSAVIRRNVLIVLAEDEGFDADDVLSRVDDAHELASTGVWRLVHALVDALVDGQLAAAERLDEAADGLGDDLFAEDNGAPRRSLQRDGFDLHKTLVRLRRVLLPMREVTGTLLRHVHEDAADDDEDEAERKALAELGAYLQDVNDHVLRAIDWTESARDMSTTVLQTHLTIQGNTLNIVMKKVTSWAAIIAVPTLITGFYGMNVPYPGYGAVSGVVLSCLLIVVCSGALWWQFRRRGWL